MTFLESIVLPGVTVLKSLARLFLLESYEFLEEEAVVVDFLTVDFEDYGGFFIKSIPLDDPIEYFVLAYLSRPLWTIGLSDILL